MTGRDPSEDGQAVVEAAIVMPVLLAMILTIVQFGVWHHAASVAHAAAVEGVRAARVHDGTAGAGEARARGFLSALGREVIEDPEVRVTRGTESATVRITGRVPSILRVFRLPVRATVTSPVERFTTDA